MANHFQLSVKGARQGDFKSETGKNNTQIPILGFGFNVISPRDPQSGLPTGRRQYQPLAVYKEWGNVSTQLFEALVTNENLTTVIVEEVRADAAGKEVVYMEIKLTNATISAINVSPKKPADPDTWPKNEIETVELTFRKIEISNKLSAKTVEDDWQP